MSNMREQLLAKTAGIRKTSAIKEDEVKRTERTQTAPGLAGALAVMALWSIYLIEVRLLSRKNKLVH